MTTLHTLKPARGAKKRRKIVGRGGSHGTFSCRGVKGQKSRSGYSRRFGFEGGRTPIVSQLPKISGFKSIRQKPVTITFEMISQKFKDGATVSPKTLKEKRLIKYKRTPYKIVKTGELDLKVKIRGGKISEGAKELVKKAGGEVIEPKEKEIKEKN